MKRKIVRDFTARRVVRVETVHPQLGRLNRGRITAATARGEWRGTWRITDHDANELPPVVGDYADAEQALLEATAAMDELVPPDELTANEIGVAR